MRYITVIVGSILSLCENYRPSVVFCVAATIYSLNYRPNGSSLCCDYTVPFELPAICSSVCCNYTVPFELSAICICLVITLYSLNYRQSVALCFATILYSLNYVLFEVVPTRKEQRYFISPQRAGHTERRSLRRLCLC
jgi:hypothetical protein